jgi:hypothetical protein
MLLPKAGHPSCSRALNAFGNANPMLTQPMTKGATSFSPPLLRVWVPWVILAAAFVIANVGNTLYVLFEASPSTLFGTLSRIVPRNDFGKQRGLPGAGHTPDRPSLLSIRHWRIVQSALR